MQWGLQEDADLVEELAEIEDGLNEWEVEFVESVCQQVLEERLSLSEKQREKAKEILEEKGDR